MGPRDLENGTVEVARRDTLEKEIVPLDGIEERIEKLLEDIQQNLYKKALKFREENTCKVDTWDEFKEKIEAGGFVLAHWTEHPKLKKKLKKKPKLRSEPFR